MNAYLAFLKKEFYDYLRSYKLFVLMMVFLALGFLNPISARYLLEVAASLLPDGIQIPVSYTHLDVYKRQVLLC